MEWRITKLSAGIQKGSITGVDCGQVVVLRLECVYQRIVVLGRVGGNIILPNRQGWPALDDAFYQVNMMNSTLYIIILTGPEVTGDSVIAQYRMFREREERLGRSPETVRNRKGISPPTPTDRYTL